MTELKIMNFRQAMYYVDHGVQPLRLDHGLSDKLVFVFSKEQTQALYGEWIQHCKDYKNSMRG